MDDDRMTRADQYARTLADAAYAKAIADGGSNEAKYDAYHLTYLKAIDAFYEQDAVDKTAAATDDLDRSGWFEARP